MNEPVFETSVPGHTLLSRGKVRDIYDLGEYLLIVSTDRLSAFDVVSPVPIPLKGIVLNRLSKFWFDSLPTDMVGNNHFISIESEDFPSEFSQYAGRAMLVQKASMVFPVECIVRGYIEGSGWKDYKNTGEICGVKLPPGLRQGDKIPGGPIFTASTKATIGHDQNITFDQAIGIVGKDVAEDLRDRSIAIYKVASVKALNRGVIIADTKFEFGLVNGHITLIDEVLTPDSSRFWPRDLWQPGRAQVSYDKQFVRDYLESIGWDKKAPMPRLPDNVIAETTKKYVEAYKVLTDEDLPEACC